MDGFIYDYTAAKPAWVSHPRWEVLDVKAVPNPPEDTLERVQVDVRTYFLILQRDEPGKGLDAYVQNVRFTVDYRQFYSSEISKDYTWKISDVEGINKHDPRFESL